MNRAMAGATDDELVIPRVLELTYTAWGLVRGGDLGYNAVLFPWDEDRCHRQKSELGEHHRQRFGVQALY
jgi:hypothetical protein